ncbi:MAG: RDD family protein [Sneathiella sp.]|nr:RDD family protein [Sneathiella sp.]
MTKSSDPLFNLSSMENVKIQSENFNGIRMKRILAYIVDVVCIFFLGIAAATVAAILGIVSFGLLTPLLAFALALVPLAYHTITIGSHWNATVGMRLFDLEVRLKSSQHPDYMAALLHAAIFYLTMAITSSLILLVSVFNSRGRLLHDYLIDCTVYSKTAP